MKKYCLLFFAAALLVLTAEENTPAKWIFEGTAQIGLFSAGADISALYRFDFGLVLGFSTDFMVSTGSDPVVGLSGGIPVYIPVYAVCGYDWELGNYFCLRAVLELGMETTFLSESVIDPVHGIDQSYSTIDFLFDPAMKANATWYPFVSIGVGVSVLVSLYDLRKSLAGIGLSFRI